MDKLIPFHEAEMMDRSKLRKAVLNSLRSSVYLDEHIGLFCHAEDIADLVMATFADVQQYDGGQLFLVTVRAEDD